MQVEDILDDLPTTPHERAEVATGLLEMIDRLNGAIQRHESYDEDRDQLAIDQFTERRDKYVGQLALLLNQYGLIVQLPTPPHPPTGNKWPRSNSTKTMIEELDLVALLTDLPAPDGSPLRLCRGDVGTVVHIYGSGQRYEVEFINAKGETVCIETLPADQVRAVDLGRVMLHYNDVVTAA